MAQKQKLKSERGRLNEGLKDMFMTMDPLSFRDAAFNLAELRETDKPGFDLVLEMFEQHKGKKPKDKYFETVNKKNLIRKNAELNELLSVLLTTYWLGQDWNEGGYFWCMMPKKKENESDEQFDIRRKRMEDNLMQVMLDVLDDCDYYIKGTQNAKNPQK